MDKPSEQSGGPGKTLRQARMDLGLSPEDVALQLHLAARQIVALENDDYKNLPQPTYVRGYIRNYALLLGLSLEPLLAAYAAAQAKTAPAPAPAAATRRNVHADDQIKYALYGLAGILVVLVLLWWLGSQSTMAPSTAPTPENAPLTTVDPSAEIAPERTSPTESENASPEKAPEKTPDKPVITPRPPERPLDRPAAAPPPAPAPVAPAPTPPAAPITPAPVPTVGTEARARVILRTEQDTWVDIRDARDTRLLYETIPAGRIVTLEGVPPFNVFLGNVDGVKIEFNGKPYDASRHKRGMVARFTLGDAPAAP